MSTDKETIEVLELFSKIPITTLANIVESLGYEDPGFEMSRLLSIQRRTTQAIHDRDHCNPIYQEAVYNLAREHYHNESEMQTNVDPIQLPFDVSEADGGVWAAAWVWIPTHMLKNEMKRLKLEEQKGKTES